MLERPRLVIATGNRHKIQEMTEVLGQWFVVEGLPKNYDAPEETGHDFLSNARIKSETASQRLNTMALADDSGTPDSPAVDTATSNSLAAGVGCLSLAAARRSVGR